MCTTWFAGLQSWPPDVSSWGGGLGFVQRGALYGEVQFIISNGHMGSPRTGRLTDTRGLKNYLAAAAGGNDHHLLYIYLKH